MKNKIENRISSEQLAFLQSKKGYKVLLCWTDIQQDLNPGSLSIQPNSGECQSVRYDAGISPAILSSKDMQKPEGLLLARACSTCLVMAQAIAIMPTALTSK